MRLVDGAKDVVARAWSAPKDRKLWAGIVAVVLAGVWLRSVRFWIDPIGLWGDEACWVFKLFDKPLTQGSSRPIGFTVVSYLLAEHGWNDERTLRLLPQLASLGTLVVFPYVGKQLFRSLGATLLMTVVVAFHPLLIDFAKEFKPYAVEVFVHLWLVACVLRYRQTQRVSTLALLLGSAIVGFLFAYNVVFLYPWLFLLVWHQDLVRRRWRRLALSGSAAAAAFALVLGVTLTLFGRVEQEEPSDFWAKKYDAFYLKERAGRSWHHSSQVVWTLERYAAQTRLAGWSRRWWEVGDNEPYWTGSRQDVFKGIDASVWIALHVLGLVGLGLWRRWAHLVLLWPPLLTQVAFNVAGRWPLGDLRMNLFVLVYVIPIAMVAVDGALSTGHRRVARAAGWTSAVTTAAALLLPPLPNPYVKHKPAGHTEMVRILERIHELSETMRRRRSRQKVPILIDPYTGCPARYYMTRHTLSMAKYGSYFEDRFRLRGLGAKRELRQHQRAWVLTSKYAWPKETIRWLKKKTKILYHESFPPTQHLFYVERK
jgi:hypothetical protein